MAKGETHLEHFDLAGGTVEESGRFVFIVGVCVDLNAEWNSFLSTVLFRRKLGADTVDLKQTKATLTEVKQSQLHTHNINIEKRVRFHSTYYHYCNG